VNEPDITRHLPTRQYRKVGFVEEGRQRQLAWVQGTYEDVLVMAILRDEWEPHS
jgi:RimJ/RimL family protein N-acetyltransferase